MTRDEIEIAKTYVSDVFAELNTIRNRIAEAEEIINKIGIVAGRLDACGGKNDALVNLMQECSKELKDMAMSYWIHHTPIGFGE